MAMTAIVYDGSTEGDLAHWSTYWQTLHPSPNVVRVFASNIVSSSQTQTSGRSAPSLVQRCGDVAGALAAAMAWFAGGGEAQAGSDVAAAGGRRRQLVVIGLAPQQPQRAFVYDVDGRQTDVRVALARSAAGLDAQQIAVPVRTQVLVNSSKSAPIPFSLAIPSITGTWQTTEARPRALETLATTTIMSTLGAVFVSLNLGGKPSGGRVFLCMQRSLLASAIDKPDQTILNLLEPANVIKSEIGTITTESASDMHNQPEPTGPRILLRSWSTNGSIASLESGNVALLHAKGKSPDKLVFCAAFEQGTGVYLSALQPPQNRSLSASNGLQITKPHAKDTTNDVNKKRKRDESEEIIEEETIMGSHTKLKTESTANLDTKSSTNGVSKASNDMAWKEMNRFQGMTHRERQEIAGEVGAINETTTNAPMDAQASLRRTQPSYLVVSPNQYEYTKKSTKYQNGYSKGTFGHLWFHDLMPESKPKPRDFDGRVFGMNQSSAAGSGST